MQEHIERNTLVKCDKYSQYIKVFWWPMVSSVKQTGIPKGYDRNIVSEDTTVVVIC